MAALPSISVKIRKKDDKLCTHNREVAAQQGRDADPIPNSSMRWQQAGGPDRTRICNLYRVKVANVYQFALAPVKTKYLRRDNMAIHGPILRVQGQLGHLVRQ